MPFKKFKAFGSYNGYCTEAKKIKNEFLNAVIFRLNIHNDLDVSRVGALVCKDATYIFKVTFIKNNVFHSVHYSEGNHRSLFLPAVKYLTPELQKNADDPISRVNRRCLGGDNRVTSSGFCALAEQPLDFCDTLLSIEAYQVVE